MSPQAVTTPPLLTLSSVATKLAEVTAVDDVVPGILEALREGLGASECSLWLEGPRGLVRSWNAGVSMSEPAEVERALVGGSGGATGNAGAGGIAGGEVAIRKA